MNVSLFEIISVEHLFCTFISLLELYQELEDCNKRHRNRVMKA